MVVAKSSQETRREARGHFNDNIGLDEENVRSGVRMHINESSGGPQTDKD